jgi:hypothetical protein
MSQPQVTSELAATTASGLDLFYCVASISGYYTIFLKHVIGLQQCCSTHFACFPTNKLSEVARGSPSGIEEKQF